VDCSLLTLAHDVSLDNIFFRALLGFVSAFVLSIGLIPWWIKISHHIVRSKVRPDTPQSHQSKNYTPTMGGICILALIILNSCLWSDCSNRYVLIVLFSMISFGCLGAWDDWCKITYSKGISARAKFIAQCLCAAATNLLWIIVTDGPVRYWNLFTTGTSAHLLFSFFISIIATFLFCWGTGVLVATSNAVNITDGLDGLATGSLIPNFVVAACACYKAYYVSSAYNGFFLRLNGEELIVLAAIVVGTLLGFLWYNTHPAQLFMGDVGSLSLGAGLATMMFLANQTLLLLVTGGFFVIETLSVIVQVVYYKKYRVRFFKMAPFHHHLEFSGWPEQTITIRATIISVVLCCIGIGLLAFITIDGIFID
jgi:phospho-N-acetylmuramoyl-pentapeptide-transferase